MIGHRLFFPHHAQFVASEATFFARERLDERDDRVTQDREIGPARHAVKGIDHACIAGIEMSGVAEARCPTAEKPVTPIFAGSMP